MRKAVPTTNYCTPEDVADTLDLPDPVDPMGTLSFSDASHPSFNQVSRMIASNEDIIDRRIRRTWRENQVVNQVLTINDYWHDINGWRSNYYSEGGSYIQLRKNVREWDTSKGDKLEIRARNNAWQDISDTIIGNIGFIDGELEKTQGQSYWIDYPYGKLYIRLRLYQQRYNALRITYRYGSEEQVPDAISRLCCLMTASQVINMQAYNIKVGMGGDISGVKDGMLRMWQEEMNTIWSSYQRSGTVRGLLR